MKFRTEIKITDAPQNLSPERLVVLVGSCFSDYIGARMEAAGWPAAVNPCGVVYNPVSMALLFRLALSHRMERREIVARSLTQREEKWVSWFMGSKAMRDTAEDCVDAVCEALDSLEESLEKAETLILTFGTSDVWLLAGSDCAVGNCHKHPASEFERRRVGVGEIVETWKMILAALQKRNPGLKVILTVSPRRYLADGFAENSRQKAVLILACEALERDAESVWYFPSYEILNDDLRDYRFYAADLLHPSATAIDYIWEKFCLTFLSPANRDVLREMEKKARASRHIPI
ncbi:MAG: GSCFA domain-containing protein [Muribaculaceae bacterium]|nr:GSCFA domain-containing protein [Muribaculaceae bacterium]